MRVPVPLILRGANLDSGSAQLVVIIALQQPGTEVLCSAPQERLRDMIDEVFPLVAACGAQHEVRSNDTATQIVFGNGSRILFRTPRRDGAGVRCANGRIGWSSKG
jgi:hypothetical protein